MDRQTAQDQPWHTLIEFNVSRQPGDESLAAEQVAQAVHRLNLPAAHLDQLKLAVDRATSNAIERNHPPGPETLLYVRVLIPERAWATDIPGPVQSGLIVPPASESETPQLSQPPSRGWGFFLTEKTGQAANGQACRLIELFLYLEGGPLDDENRSSLGG